MLNINKNAAGSNLTVSLEGRLDTTTAPQLEEVVKAEKTMNKQGKMVVKNPSEEVKEIFDVTGFSDILTIE